MCWLSDFVAISPIAIEMTFVQAGTHLIHIGHDKLAADELKGILGFS